MDSPEPDAADLKTALITGATSGVGLALAKRLAREGWRVLLHGRSPERLSAAQRKVERLGVAQPIRANLSDLDSVRGLAEEVRGATGRLDALVNNAGLLVPKCRLTPQHIETTMAVNALAPWVLFRSLRPLLEETASAHGEARMVNVTSAAHGAGRFRADTASGLADEMREPERGYASFKAYAQSKLALTAWTLEAARRLEGTGVTANCCHPGVVRTRIFPGLGGAGGFFASAFSVFYLSPAQGARAPHRIATSPEWREKTGRYLRRTLFAGLHDVDPPKQAQNAEWTGAVWGAMQILSEST